MFTVTIITKCGDHTITEKAGLRGERTIVSVAGPKGIKMNPRQKKLEGWKTREGARNFISEALLNDIEKGFDSWYQIEEA